MLHNAFKLMIIIYRVGMLTLNLKKLASYLNMYKSKSLNLHYNKRNLSRLTKEKINHERAGYDPIGIPITSLKIVLPNLIFYRFFKWRFFKVYWVICVTFSPSGIIFIDRYIFFVESFKRKANYLSTLTNLLLGILV